MPWLPGALAARWPSGAAPAPPGTGGPGQRDSLPVAQDQGATQPPCLGDGVALCVQPGDGGQAACPQRRCRLLAGAARHEHANACLALRCRTQHGVGEKRQPGGRLRIAADIAPAAAELLVPAGGIDRHRDAGLVAEAAELHRVDGQAQTGRAGADRGHRRRQPRGQRAGGVGQVRGIERGEGTIGRAGRQQQIGQHRCQGAAMAGNRGGILAVQRAGQRCARRTGHAGFVQQRRDQHRQGQVEAGAGEIQCRQRLGADQHDLGIGVGAVDPDQFDAGLGDLAVGRQLAAAHAQALPGIGQPQRARRHAEPRGGDAGNLRRGVGAHAHHALAVGVHQAEGLVRHGSAGTRQQAVLEFQQRRLDALVTVGGEHRHDRFDRGSLGFGFRRQQVAQAGGEEGRIGGVVAHRRQGGTACDGGEGWRARFRMLPAAGHA